MNEELRKNFEKLSQGREYRSVKDIKPTGDEYIVRGLATTFNQPYILSEDMNYRFEEIVAAEAFKDCDMSDVIMQYDHKGRVFARTSNKTLRVNVTKEGLEIEANLGGTEQGKQLYEEIKGEYTNKMSIGFTVKKDKRERIEDRENNIITFRRTILSFKKLYDVSAVSLPANDMTSISSRSYVDGVIAELEAERLQEETRNSQIRKIKILSQI